MELLAESAARVTILALAVALILKIVGIQAPRLVHRAWAAVAALMLLLPVLLAWGPRIAVPVLSRPPAEAVALAPGTDGNVETPAAVSARVAATASSTGRPIAWRTLATTAYLAGLAVLLLRLAVGLLRARTIRRLAVPLRGRLSHPGCVTPMTVGMFAPVVILPRDWIDWDPADLAAILSHENEHVRRRDPLVTVVTLVNRAVFWFHPLSWWLHREIARRAEQACDAAVVAQGHDAERYSSCLVGFARRVMVRRGRVVPLATAMPGSGLSQRLRMLEHPPARVTSAVRVTCAAAAAMAIAVACAMATPAAATATTAQATTDTGWRVHTTPHFELFHDGLTTQQIARVERDAETAYGRLSQALRHEMPGVMRLVLTERDITGDALPNQLRELMQRGGRPEGQVIVLPVDALAGDSNLIVHELTHQFAFEIVPKVSVSAPLLIEGLAEHMRERWRVGDLREVRAAAATGAVPPAREPDINSRPWGRAFFDFVRAEHGEEGVRRLLFALRSRGTVTQAVTMAFDTTNDTFDQAFQAYVIATFGGGRR